MNITTKALITLIFLGFTGQSYALSVKQSPSLSRLLHAMHEEAGEMKTNMLDFQVRERFWTQKKPSTCKVVSSKEIVLKVVQYYRQLGNPAPQYYKQGLQDLYRIVGKGRYYACHQFESGYYAYKTYESFIGIDRKYRIQIMTGWDD